MCCSIENLTALEYDKGAWRIYRYTEDPIAQAMKIPRRFRNELDNDEIFKDLVTEFMTVKK